MLLLLLLLLMMMMMMMMMTTTTTTIMMIMPMTTMLMMMFLFTLAVLASSQQNGSDFLLNVLFCSCRGCCLFKKVLGGCSFQRLHSCHHQSAPGHRQSRLRQFLAISFIAHVIASPWHLTSVITLRYLNITSPIKPAEKRTFVRFISFLCRCEY